MSNNEATATEVAVTDERGTAVTLTPSDMLAIALEKGSDLEVVSKLMDLQDRYEAKQAVKAYDEAMSIAKSKFSKVKRSGTGDHGTKHETLVDLDDAIREPFSEYGLSYSFETESTERGIQVTCVISHVAGHSKRNSLHSVPDDSGSKNDIQAIGSAVTYLQRYTLKAALGLAASKDDDGKAAGGVTILNFNQSKWVINHQEIANRIRNAPTFKVLGNVRDLLASLEFIHPLTRKDWAAEVQERAKELDAALGKQMTGEKAKPSHADILAQAITDFKSAQSHEDISTLDSEYGSLLDTMEDWTGYNAALDEARARIG